MPRPELTPYQRKMMPQWKAASEHRAFEREEVKEVLNTYVDLHFVVVRTGLLCVEHEGKEAYLYPATCRWWPKGRRKAMRKTRSIEAFVEEFAPNATKRINWDEWLRQHAIPSKRPQPRLQDSAHNQ